MEAKLNMQARLSTLWIFLLFNILFRDMHELFRPGLLEQMISGTVNGTLVSNEMLLVAGIILEIPIAMIVLSRILNYKINRWANISAGILMTVSVVTNPPRDLDDYWFISMGLIASISIVYYAWKWQKPQEPVSA